ncbi:MAG: S8 family serine peptidase [Cyclobacteriaceae bacterium]
MPGTKRSVLSILFISNPLAIYAQSDLYYWGYKTKYTLTTDSLQAVLIPKNVNKQLNFQSLNDMVESESMSSLQNRQEVMLKLKKTSTLTPQKFNDFHLLPIFKSGDFPLIPTGEIVFQPKVNVDYQQVSAFCKGKITFQNQSKYGTITVTPENIVELLSLANQIYQSGLVEWCEPNYIVEIVKHQQIPTDQFFAHQYYLNQNNNIDINAPEAWQLSTGLNGVRVAVIDDGVKVHDDLNGRVLQGFTPVDPNGFGAPTNNLPPVNEYIVGHGQACAGIIGATHNNIGVAGIAPCSEIVPVNIFNNWDLNFNYLQVSELYG